MGMLKSILEELYDMYQDVSNDGKKKARCLVGAEKWNSKKSYAGNGRKNIGMKLNIPKCQEKLRWCSSLFPCFIWKGRFTGRNSEENSIYLNI